MTTFHSLSAVFEQVGQKQNGKYSIITVDIDGAPVTIKTNAGRIKMYKNQPTCVCCGKTADTVRVMKSPHLHDVDGYVLDVCITTPDGYIPLTTDHILLASSGGMDAAINYQTMCHECNSKKADVMSNAEIAMVRANPRMYAKTWVDINYLEHLLDLNEEYNRLVASNVDRKQVLQFRQAMRTARSKLQYGKKVPVIKPVVIDLAPSVGWTPTWKDWWNSRPSLLAPVYGWLGQYHSLFLAL